MNDIVEAGGALAAPGGGDLSPEGLIARAIDRGLDVDALERLLAMRERLREEQAREAFFRALASFQRECPSIPKTRQVGGRGQGVSYRYASLDDIVRAIGETLAAHGLSITFDSTVSDGMLVARCRVHHEAGHCEESTFAVPLDGGGRMNAAQQFGSAGTYARRYALCNALGIVTADEDDDARSFGGSGGEVRPGRRGRAESRRSGSAPAREGWSPSEAQVKRLWAIAREHGVPKEVVGARLVELGAVGEDGRPHTHLLTREQYDELCGVWLPGIGEQLAAEQEDATRQHEPDTVAEPQADDLPF